MIEGSQESISIWALVQVTRGLVGVMGTYPGQTLGGGPWRRSRAIRPALWCFGPKTGDRSSTWARF